MLRRWFATAALAVCVACPCAGGNALFAAEVSTDAERRWRELRDSADVQTKLLAERWYGVVRLQEWDDASGKFRTTAKYVQHDPDLAWVKLRVIRGTGDERVVRDVTIPTAKLSKTCQSRVRQISVLAEKVAAAAIEQKERKSDKAEGIDGAERDANESAGNREMAEESRVRRGENDAGRAGLDAGEVLTEAARPERERQRPRRRQAADAARSQVVPSTASGDPLPVILPPLPSDRLPLGA